MLWNGYFQAISFEKAYDTAQYTQAQALLQDSKMDASNLHNLGNVSYRLWQEGKSEELSLLQDAQTYYSGALLQKEHPDTRYNYDFVTELLKNTQVSQDEESGEKKDKETPDTQS